MTRSKAVSVPPPKSELAVSFGSLTTPAPAEWEPWDGRSGGSRELEGGGKCAELRASPVAEEEDDWDGTAGREGDCQAGRMVSSYASAADAVSPA